MWLCHHACGVALRKTDSVVAMDWIMKADVRGPITSTPLWFKLYGQSDVVVEHDVESMPIDCSQVASDVRAFCVG